MKLPIAAIFALATSHTVFAQFNLPKPETPIAGAASMGDAQGVRKLLESGANPNEGRFLGIAPVMFSLMMQNREMLEAFADAGADWNVRDARGATTLMWAVYNDHADPEIVRAVLRMGVDPNARDAKGETALDWAVKRGNPDIVRILEEAGASREPRIREAVEKSLALLQKSRPQFVRVSGCVSCHHQTLPSMAIAIARDRGIPFDQQEAVRDHESVLAFWKSAMSIQNPVIPDPPIVVSSLLVGLADVNHPGDAMTSKMSALLAQLQDKDGSWKAGISRQPMESSDFTATALSLRAVKVYGDGGEQVTRASEWLANREPRSNEDRTMQLLGLAWAEADREVIDRQARKLIAQQQASGGWSQLDGMEPDAYATGQALVALNRAGALRSSDAAYRKGVDYLLRNQFADGSWRVVSRSFPLQPYKESGFPHGKDQWISAAGTSWAAMALGLAVEPRDEATDGGN